MGEKPEEKPKEKQRNILKIRLDPKNLLADIVAYIGWTEEEFVGAIAEYSPDKKCFDFHIVFKQLWRETNGRIHSSLMNTHKFYYYNDWFNIIIYGLASYRKHVFNPLPRDEKTRVALIKDLCKNKKASLPSEANEREILMGILSLMLTLEDYILQEPTESYFEICAMKDRVEKAKKALEEKREQNRLKKLERRNKKKHRK